MYESQVNAKNENLEYAMRMTNQGLQVDNWNWLASLNQLNFLPQGFLQLFAEQDRTPPRHVDEKLLEPLQKAGSAEEFLTLLNDAGLFGWIASVHLRTRLFRDDVVQFGGTAEFRWFYGETPNELLAKANVWAHQRVQAMREVCPVRDAQRVINEVVSEI